jgi:hypothetical protein
MIAWLVFFEPHERASDIPDSICTQYYSVGRNACTKSHCISILQAKSRHGGTYV